MCEKRHGSSEQLTQGQQIFRFVFLIIMFAYGVFSYVMAHEAYMNLVQVGTDYTNLINSWEMEVVTDVKKHNDDCSGLNAALNSTFRALGEYKPLFSYEFPGFTDGCDCRQAVNAQKYNVKTRLESGSCNKNQTRALCKDINTYRGSSTILSFHDQPKVYCGFRVKDYSFRKKYLKQQNTCASPSKERLCGSGENAFCVPKALRCPISSLNMNSLYENTEYSGLTYQSGSASPMTLFLVRQSTQICLKDYTMLLRHNGKYTLQKGYYTDSESCISKPDSRFDQLGYYYNTEKSVLQYVYGTGHYNLIPSVDRGSVIYSTHQDYNFNYFGRRFIKWSFKQECRDVLEDMFTAKDKFNSAQGMQLVVFIINILVCLVLGIIFPIMGLLNACGYDLACIKGDGEEEYKRMGKIKKIMSYGTKALQLPFIIIAIIASKKIKKIYSVAAENTCSAAHTNDFLNNLDKTMTKDVYEKNIAMIGALVALILLDIVLLIKEKRDENKIKQAKESKQQERDRLTRQREHEQEQQERAKDHEIEMEQNEHTNKPNDPPTYSPQMQQPLYQPQQPVYQPQMQQPVYLPPIQQPEYQPQMQQPVYVMAPGFETDEQKYLRQQQNQGNPMVNQEQEYLMEIQQKNAFVPQ